MGRVLLRKIDIFRPVETDALGAVSFNDIHLGKELDVGAHPHLESVLRLRFQLAKPQELLSLGSEVGLLDKILFLHFSGGIDDHRAFVTVDDDRVVVLYEAVILPRPTTAGISSALATIDVCDVRPPTSVTKPEVLFRLS